MPDPIDRTSQDLERFRDYLETLSFLQIDPRLRGRFGFSDIVSKTLWEAYQALDRLHQLDEAGQKRFLRRMLVNNLMEEIDRARSAKRDYRLERALEEAADGSSCRLRSWLAAEDSPPDARLIEQETALALLEALAQLPPRQREAILLQKYHGWSLAQIAEHLDCTVGAVAGLHANGLRKLRQLLSAQVGWFDS
jgi:RNA polymerase sigma-70 factor (subfamily 1)